MNNLENELAKVLMYYSQYGPIKEEEAIKIATKIGPNLLNFVEFEQKRQTDEADEIRVIAIVDIIHQIGENDFERNVKTKIFKGYDVLKDVKKWYEELKKEYPFGLGNLVLEFHKNE